MNSHISHACNRTNQKRIRFSVEIYHSKAWLFSPWIYFCSLQLSKLHLHLISKLTCKYKNQACSEFLEYLARKTRILFDFSDHFLHRQPSHRQSRRDRSKSPAKFHQFHHTGPQFHQNFHDWQRAGHRQIFGGHAHTAAETAAHAHAHHHDHSRRFSSHRPATAQYFTDSDYTDFAPAGHWRHSAPAPPYKQHRSRSSPPVNSRHDLPPDFGVFSAHDLHAANERRASRRDLADLRDQLFVRSTSHNDLLGAGAPTRRADARHRASGRDLLSHWERQHCETCKQHTLKRHSVSHPHLFWFCWDSWASETLCSLYWCFFCTQLFSSGEKFNCGVRNLSAV